MSNKDKKNILVVAPHCDDEVLGCGGTIAKFAEQKHNVYVIMVTNGHIGAPELFSKEDTKKNRKEACKSCDYLGVEEVKFFDFPAPRLDSIPSYRLSIALQEYITEKQIEVLYLPHSGDIHRDHIITYECGLVASRPINDCPVKKILAYETPSETEWAPPSQHNAFMPTYFEDITGFLEKKIRAFSNYESQYKEPPHLRSHELIRNLARQRGSTVGIKHAEAFMVVREISH